MVGHRGAHRPFSMVENDAAIVTAMVEWVEATRET
jgi:hypothetical protein